MKLDLAVTVFRELAIGYRADVSILSRSQDCVVVVRALKIHVPDNPYRIQMDNAVSKIVKNVVIVSGYNKVSYL